MSKTVLALLLAALLGLAGCGGGTEETAKSSIADSLMKQQPDQPAAKMLSLERDEAECIADGMVDGIGVDQLQEYGMLTEEGTVDQSVGDVKLSRKDAETLTDAMFSCTDVRQMVRKSLAKEMGDQDKAVRACVDKVLTEDALRSMFVAVFSGNSDDASKELVGPLMNCAIGSMDPDQLTQ